MYFEERKIIVFGNLRLKLRTQYKSKLINSSQSLITSVFVKSTVDVQEKFTLMLLRVVAQRQESVFPMQKKHEAFFEYSGLGKQK